LQYQDLFLSNYVLGPFIGSGQTAIAAKKTQRHYVGYDINEEYVELAGRRIKEFLMEFNSPKLFDFRQKKVR
jgi:site-specific DNA-methyltransferase (adenine-specific)